MNGGVYILSGFNNALLFFQLSLLRPIKPTDILPPERGHEVAKELGIPYFETSIVAQFGVKDVFDNAIRAALISRRHLQFWKSHLKKVQRPLLQAPFLPPRPPRPVVGIPDPPPIDGEGPDSLFCQLLCADVLFLLQAGATHVFAHKVYLATSCSKFYDLFTLDLEVEGMEQEGEESSEGSEEEEQSRRGAKEQAGRTKSLDIDKESEGSTRGSNRLLMLQQGSLRTSQSDNALPARGQGSIGPQGAGRALLGWGRGFLGVYLEMVDDPVTGQPRLMTVVSMDDLIQKGPFEVRTHLSDTIDSMFNKILRRYIYKISMTVSNYLLSILSAFSGSAAVPLYRSPG